MSSYFPIVFVGNLLLLAILMKLLTFKLVDTNKSIWRTPCLVPTKNLLTPEVGHILVRQLGFFVLTFLTLQLLQNTLSPIEHWYQRLSVFPLVWFTTEWIGATLMLVFFIPQNTPFIHNNPFASRSVSDFWGNRWNRWISPWLGMAARKISTSPYRQIMCAFVLSGIFHELMFNLPFHFATGEKVYGNMLFFFVLQGLIFSIDRAYLKGFSIFWRRTWLWVTLISSSPLFLERPLLYFFGLSS